MVGHFLLTGGCIPCVPSLSLGMVGDAVELSTERRKEGSPPYASESSPDALSSLELSYSLTVDNSGSFSTTRVRGGRILDQFF